QLGDIAYALVGNPSAAPLHDLHRVNAYGFFGGIMRQFRLDLLSFLNRQHTCPRRIVIGLRRPVQSPSRPGWRAGRESSGREPTGEASACARKKACEFG